MATLFTTLAVILAGYLLLDIVSSVIFKAYFRAKAEYENAKAK